MKVAGSQGVVEVTRSIECFLGLILKGGAKLHADLQVLDLV